MLGTRHFMSWKGSVVDSVGVFLTQNAADSSSSIDQFNDVQLQENVCMDTSSPFFDLNALDSIEYEKMFLWRLSRFLMH
ncbi:hypothetical protein L1987_24862 [Smallanthus sonchifolius]|uniref:Uncharacterized protein n=1 Tax=Smallanthus sonchifolius TaxID=185202 RepID=A0ACB9IKW7_9ASTR|nr:hypothetical protein L1987_24862 [Smallanthus sonchifolius]